MRASTALGLAALAATRVAADLPTIEAKGAKFFTSDGNQFYIKGIAYQLTEDDPLANGDQCQRDATLMKTLGANSIRVYHVDPAADHKACMTAFADAGIYAWIDLDTTTTYVYDVPTKTPSWNKGQLEAFKQVMDAFVGYSNVAGFFVANELLNDGSMSDGAPYIKAAGADMKAYRDSQNYRKVPIGYSAADIPDLRPNLQNYMACGDAPLDFYGLNAYEWCGENTYEGSGYSQLQKNASDYSIPIFFSETGCILPRERLFQDQSAIFGKDMADTWSGAIIYEWIEENNTYGLINYGPKANVASDAANHVVESYTRQGTPTAIQPDFSNLSKQWATNTPSGVKADSYKPSNSAPACPAFTTGLWEVSGNVALPTLGTSAATVKPPKATGIASPSRGGGPTAGTTSQAPSSTPTGTATGSGAAASSTHKPGSSASTFAVSGALSLVSAMLAFCVWA